MHVENNGDFLIVSPSGRIDSTNATVFAADINALLAQNENKNLIINFEQIEYISSAGLRILIVIDKTLKSASLQLTVSSLNQNIQKIFDASGFSKIFNITTSVSKSVKS